MFEWCGFLLKFCLYDCEVGGGGIHVPPVLTCDPGGGGGKNEIGGLNVGFCEGLLIILLEGGLFCT